MLKFIKNLSRLYKVLPIIFELVELMQRIVAEWDNGLPPSDVAQIKAKVTKLGNDAAIAKSTLEKGGIII